MRKNDELFIKNEKLCIENEKLCIKNDDFAGSFKHVVVFGELNFRVRRCCLLCIYGD